MRLLLAEDEYDLNTILTQRLRKEGYVVDSCMDGEETLYYLSNETYDCAVLDIMMPKKDGLEVLRTIRRRNIMTPVIFLTARDSLQDKVTGLDSGAQDYLIKPFAIEELLARLRAILRKSSGKTDNCYRIDDLVMDTASKRVFRGEKEIRLSVKEFLLLEYLLRNAGIVLTREQIEKNIWNMDYEGSSNMIDVYIRYLRKKIDEGADRKLIHTVRGIGYVLREEQ